MPVADVRLYVYRIGPVDEWIAWVPFKDVRSDTRNPDDFDVELCRMWSLAQDIAKELGWEGDVSAGPFVSSLPVVDGLETALLVGWKQANNGASFIGSPIELPHLQGAPVIMAECKELNDHPEGDLFTLWPSGEHRRWRLL